MKDGICRVVPSGKGLGGGSATTPQDQLPPPHFSYTLKSCNVSKLVEVLVI
nr:MAG TPA: hypothetical protein [Caudoviricetes sp.]